MNTTILNKRKIVHSLTLLLASIAPFSDAFAASGYTISDLGANVTPNAINEVGQIAGDNGSSNAFLYSNGVFNTFLGSNGLGVAYGLNNLGHVVGTSYTSGKAFVYDGTTVADIVPDLPNVSLAYGINDSDQIVGDIDFDFTTGYSQFLYHRASDTLEIASGLQVNGNTTVVAINNSGQFIVNAGHSSGDDFTLSTRLYNNSTSFTEIPLIAGELSNNGMMSFAINNLGHVSGSGPVTDIGQSVFLYDGTNTISIGSGSGVGMNDLDQIVGINADGAFLYDGSTLNNLSNLIDPSSGWVLQNAKDINNLGQIIGTGLLNGEFHGFLLTPTAVPVPGAVWLFGSALAAVAGLRNRKQLV
jgi:uncharacterized membrane protein